MKQTPVIKREEFADSIDDSIFISDRTTFLGLRMYLAKEQVVGFYGRVALLFVFSDTLDEDNVLFTQVMFDLENKEELQYATYSPVNVSFLEGQALEVFQAIVKDATPGVNSYGTNLVFGQPFSPTTETYYEFECIYSDPKTETNTIKKVRCTKGTYLQLCQFLFWFQCRFPLAPNIFQDPKYKKSMTVKCSSLIYDGSTQTVFAGEKRIMAHFTLYYNEGINQGMYGFNIPCEIAKNRFERKPLMESDYINLYGHDDTVLPDRIFAASSPYKTAMLLTGRKGEDHYIIFTLDDNMIQRVHWMDWGWHIYNRGVI